MLIKLYHLIQKSRALFIVFSFILQFGWALQFSFIFGKQYWFSPQPKARTLHTLLGASGPARPPPDHARGRRTSPTHPADGPYPSEWVLGFWSPLQMPIPVSHGLVTAQCDITQNFKIGHLGLPPAQRLPRSPHSVPGEQAGPKPNPSPSGALQAVF